MLEKAVPMADALNRHKFARRGLSENSYIARAGPGTADFRDQIRAEMDRKFPGSVPALLNQDTRDHALLIYGYLLKSLPFGAEFDSLLTPLPFKQDGGRFDVASFGVRTLDDIDSHGREMQAQVTILDYVSNDDFVVQLTPTGPRDEIVLAKIAPNKTLEETVAAVRRRIGQPTPGLRERRLFSAESLVIPKLSANVERRYSEIKDLYLVGVDLYVADALQVIRFRLDETGARLESEVALSFDDGHEPTQPGQRMFIFDRPFLIYLIERDADQPYFAAWIANTELMEPYSK